MSDDSLDPNDVPTKPLPVPAGPGAPTEPLAAPLVAESRVDSTPLMPAPSRVPAWLVPLVIALVAALALVLAVAVLPPLLAGRAEPAPSVTPTLPAATPTVTEEAPQGDEEPAEPPVVVEPEPQPTESAPEPTETPVEPEPTATP